MHLFPLAGFLALIPSAFGAPQVADEDYIAFIDNTAKILALDSFGGCSGTTPGDSAGAGPPQPRRGGGDGSFVDEFDRPDNFGLCCTPIDGFFPVAEQRTAVNMTVADQFALSAIASLQTCGGPTIRWFPGRDDLPGLEPSTSPNHRVVNPDGLLPSPHDSYTVVVGKFERMGFSKVEMMTVVTGSHTIGGVHGANNPALTNETFLPFDSTPGIFDNDVFKQVLDGYCPLPVDCEMAADPEIRSTIQSVRPLLCIYHPPSLFYGIPSLAADESFFFASYSTAFEKFLNLTVSPLTYSLSHAVDPAIVASVTTNSTKFPFNRVTLKPLPPRPVSPLAPIPFPCQLGILLSPN
ncbi:heme peroxidase [Blyttiomyces helicus]|uniref:Peroxidase n=1 Tax=Blyttiomyces helicus TaxID=388810 RepID=A0A4P9WFZ0_9FUNG|nr:heme peroxidase [Blyttiomyces helicus]|eukprot:RKO90805.1 heme peroxidase [Blyttiomyces helicus]